MPKSLLLCIVAPRLVTFIIIMCGKVWDHGRTWCWLGVGELVMALNFWYLWYNICRFVVSLTVKPSASKSYSEPRFTSQSVGPWSTCGYKFAFLIIFLIHAVPCSSSSDSSSHWAPEALWHFCVLISLSVLSMFPRLDHWTNPQDNSSSTDEIQEDQNTSCWSQLLLNTS